jgi:hypothetical protein
LVPSACLGIPSTPHNLSSDPHEEHDGAIAVALAREPQLLVCPATNRHEGIYNWCRFSLPSPSPDAIQYVVNDPQLM